MFEKMSEGVGANWKFTEYKLNKKEKRNFP